MGQAMGQDMWSVGQIGPVTIHHNWDMEQNLYAFKYNIYTYLYIYSIYIIICVYV